MAKLGKVKIMVMGQVRENTTYPGQIELYAYYDVDKDFFYFEPIEIQKHFPDCKLGKHNFSQCGSKENAIAVIKTYMGEATQEKRFLRISLEIEAVLGKEKEDLSQQLQDMCTYGGAGFRNVEVGKRGIWNETKRNIGIGIERVKQVTIGKEQVYVSCNENWEVRKDDTGHSGRHNLVEWTQEIEDFIVNMQKTMDTMCKQIVEFFNVENEEQLRENISTVQSKNLLS